MGFPIPSITMNSLAALNLAVMIAGYIILFSGSIYARRKKIRQHVKMADTAVILGSLSFMWMGYSLISDFFGKITVSVFGVIIVFHIITGLSALFAGIFFALDEIKKTKTSMIMVFLIWSAAMISGVAVYLNYYF